MRTEQHRTHSVHVDARPRGEVDSRVRVTRMEPPTSSWMEPPTSSSDAAAAVPLTASGAPASTDGASLPTGAANGASEDATTVTSTGASEDATTANLHVLFGPVGPLCDDCGECAGCRGNSPAGPQAPETVFWERRQSFRAYHLEYFADLLMAQAVNDGTAVSLLVSPTRDHVKMTDHDGVEKTFAIKEIDQGEGGKQEFVMVPRNYPHGDGHLVYDFTIES